MMKPLACTVLLSVALASPASLAADKDGRYAADGVGHLDCAAFTEARAEQTPQLHGFAGWVDGYLSGINSLQPETFDLTPWQTVDLLLAKLGQFCEAHPETRFVDALNQLAVVLYPDRLTEESEIVRVRRGEQAVFLYREMVERIEARLGELGFDPGAVDGTFDEASSAALMRYQNRNGLPASGLPDQPTLNALFP